MHAITTPSTGVALVNLLKVDPTHQNELISLLSENIETVVKQLPGWTQSTFIASRDGQSVVIYSQCALIPENRPRL